MANLISDALGMFQVGWQQVAVPMFDWMIESEQALSKEDKEKRGYFQSLSALTKGNTELNLQATNCDRIFGSGFHLQIHGRITNWLMNPGMAEPEHGGLKVTLTQNGSHPAPSYGSMENVSILHPFAFLGLMIMVLSAAGAGKSVIWYDNVQTNLCW